MKIPATTLIFGLPAAFAAGWWFHPVSDSAAEKDRVPREIASERRNAVDREDTAGNAGRSNDPLVSRTARTFPNGGALTWLRSLGGLEMIQNPAGKDVLQELLKKLGTEEFAELDRAVLQELQDPNLPGKKKKFAIRLLILTWPEWVRLDPQATLASMAWAGKADREVLNEDSVVQTVFRRYAEQDQAAALAAVNLMPEDRRKDAGHGIMLAAALRDPFAALELIPQLGVNASGDPRAIVDAAVLRDPLRTAALTGPISGDAPQDNTFLRTMEQWSETDPAAAAAWIESYQGPGKVTGMTAVLAEQAGTDAAGAAARLLAVENPGQSPYASRVAEKIARQLSGQSDPASALNWATKLPADVGEEAATAALGEWVRKDVTAASEWIARQPAGVIRDNAAFVIVPLIKSSEPASAWEWAQAISAPEMRAAAMIEVRKEWQKQNATAAQAAVDALSADQRAILDSKR